MSIYDNVGPEPAKEAPQAPEAKPEQQPAPPKPKPKPKAKGCGCGCGSCLLACLGVLLICGLAGAGGVWFVASNLADWSRDAVVGLVDGTSLPDQQKQRITAQVDRILEEYRDGRLDTEQLQSLAEQLAQSSLFGLLMVQAAQDKYVAPSGLDDEEKADADIALQRLLSGVQQTRIAREDLETVFDHISTVGMDGNRQLRPQISDEELRNMLAECERLADTAGVPRTDFHLDVAAEVERIVDETLSLEP
jgi:hypothetical protein